VGVFYHIVLTPKYRRKVIYNQYRSSLGEIFHRLCRYKGVEFIEGHLMPDHVHMLVSIPPRISISSFMGYLKGKSALMMFDNTPTSNINLGIAISGQKAIMSVQLGLMKPR
jgi:putative transposase